MQEGENQMKTTQVFQCKKCGKKFGRWVGRCDSCGEWNSVEEIEVKQQTQASLGPVKQSVKLNTVLKRTDSRIDTCNAEINRMFGGGIVKDSVSIISAPPGAGKSTFATNLCGILCDLGYKVLYASGEESETQIKARADRILGSNISDNFYIISDPQKRLESVINAVNEMDPDFIVVDSIQTFTIDRCLPSRSGSPTQVVECANEIVTICKDKTRPRASLIIGQMVKNDELAGPRQLEHLVDAVYYLDGDPYEDFRICTSSKNRFGELETVFFSMSNGMSPIDNPSEFLITQRSDGRSAIGSAITIIKEGSMPVAVEIESLISKSFTPYPSRIGDGLRRDQMNIIVSILEERCGMNFYDKNVIIKVMGNIKLMEPSTSLALAMSIISSFKKKPLYDGFVFVGDIGLTGELKKVQSLESKIKEAERMGFKSIVIPDQSVSGNYNININKCKTIMEAIACGLSC